MSTDFFRRYLDLLNEAETTGRLVANQPVIAGQPLSSVQMAAVDFARSMGNNPTPDVQQAYDLAKQAGVKPGPGGSSNNRSETNSNALQALIKPRTDGGNYIDPKTGIIMYVPRKSPKAGSDAPDPDPKALDWKLLNQPEGQEIKNALRSAGLEVMSVDKPSLFGSYPVAGVDPEKLAKALSGAGNAPGQGGQPPAAEIPHIKPEVVEPNTNVALPSSGTFTNDMALANLADKIKKDAESGKTSKEVQDGPDSGNMGGDARCKICGTKKINHQNLQHAFVASDSTEPTIAATPGVQPGGTAKRGGVQPGGTAKRGGGSAAPAGQGATPDVSKVTAALATIEKLLDKYKIKLKENINQLAPVDQMKTWRTLLEYSEVDEATRKTRRPTKAEIEAYLKNLPADPNSTRTAAAPAAAAPAAPPNETPEQRRTRLQRAAQATIDRTATAKPAAEPSIWDRFNRPSDVPTGPAQAMPGTQAAGKEAGLLSKAWQDVKGATSKVASKVASKAAIGLGAIAQIYDAYKQIIALPRDMPEDQYRAAVTKIVARQVEDFGLFWVGAILGGLLAGVFSGSNPVGAIVGFVAGGAGGIAASYLLGDSVGEISDQIVDKLYGTGGTSSMSADDKAILMQNITIIQDFVKANPSAVDADLKARIDRVMAAAKSAGVAPGQGGQPAVAPPPAATGPKEGDRGVAKSGRPKVFKNGKWEYAD